MKKDEFRSKLEFRLLWWEMEEIEPLTPFSDVRRSPSNELMTYHESNEIPAPIRTTKEERVLNPESYIL